MPPLHQESEEEKDCRQDLRPAHDACSRFSSSIWAMGFLLGIFSVAGVATEKIPNKNPMAQIEEEKREHHNKMLKMEREMEEVFERKVKEKQRKLRDSETDLDRRHKESMEKLEQQKRELEAKISAFAQEKTAWEQINGISVEELKRLSMESLDGKSKKKSGALSGVSFRMGR